MTKPHDTPRTTHRVIPGWPALIVLVVLALGGLYLMLGDHSPGVELRPATGTAQAMAAASRLPGNGAGD